MWRRAGEELITHRQAGEQQTDAMRARLSSAQPGWREERPGWRETEGRKEEWEKESRGGDSNAGKCNEKCENV